MQINGGTYLFNPSWDSVLDRVLKQNAPVENPVLQRSGELEAYVAMALPPRSSGPMDFWKTHKDRFPTLARLARKFLSAPCSSVYSERLFSEFGHVYEDTRSRLLPARGEKILFLHHNVKKFI